MDRIGRYMYAGATLLKLLESKKKKKQVIFLKAPSSATTFN